MVTFKLDTNVHRIADKITATGVNKAIEAQWFTADIDIVISDPLGGTVIADFSFLAANAPVVEVTLDGSRWRPINGGEVIVGRQSIYQRVLNGDKLNYRASLSITELRVVVGEV